MIIGHSAEPQQNSAGEQGLMLGQGTLFTSTSLAAFLVLRFKPTTFQSCDEGSNSYAGYELLC